MSESVEQLAQQRLEAAERRLARRSTVSLAETGRAFWHYPSPWIISGYLAAALVARVAVGGGRGPTCSHRSSSCSSSRSWSG